MCICNKARENIILDKYQRSQQCKEKTVTTNTNQIFDNVFQLKCISNFIKNKSIYQLNGKDINNDLI